MTIIAQTPDATGLATAQTQSSAIAGTAQNTIASNQFVYFAGFDGTNNNRDAVYVSGNPLDTNVAQLTYQVESISNSNIGVKYFSGPGTTTNMGSGLAFCFFKLKSPHVQTLTH